MESWFIETIMSESINVDSQGFRCRHLHSYPGDLVDNLTSNCQNSPRYDCRSGMRDLLFVFGCLEALQDNSNRWTLRDVCLPRTAPKGEALAAVSRLERTVLQRRNLRCWLQNESTPILGSRFPEIQPDLISNEKSLHFGELSALEQTRGRRESRDQTAGNDCTDR